MKLLAIAICFVLVTSSTCWSLNDLYKQLVDGIKHGKHNHRKRTETAKPDLSKSWGQRAEVPPSYEVQSFDVETSNPVKKNVPSRPEAPLPQAASQFKPTIGISNFVRTDSLMNFHNLYAPRKPQVTAWSEWSEKAATPQAYVPIIDPAARLRASRKLESAQARRRFNNTQEPLPTQAISLFHGSISNTQKADAKKNIQKATTQKLNTQKMILPNASTQKVDINRLSTHQVSTKSVNTPKVLANTKALTQKSTSSINHNTQPAIQNTTAAITQKVTEKYKESVPTKLNHDSKNMGQINAHHPGPSLELPCRSSLNNPCPTAPVMLSAKGLKGTEDSKAEKDSKQTALDILEHAKLNNDGEIPAGAKSKLYHSFREMEETSSSNEGDTQAQKKGDIKELPDLRGINALNFNQETFKFRECKIEARSSVCGVVLKVSPSTCNGKVSFTALLARLLNNIDLATPSNDLIVHGKFDVTDFSINRCKGLVSFNLLCRELLDIIPNKVRLAKGKLELSFSYEQQPKTIASFNIKLSGILSLDFRSRRLDVSVEKPYGSTLFKIGMKTVDLELPEFTKLFTEGDISQQELPPDLATLVTSSLRNPRITGLYDSGGAFEFIASAKSPASIFPSQPMVYVIIQKPRLGKVVSGLIASFESSMYRSFLSSILNQDLSNIPLFSDARTDMAIGVSPDGLFVVKDENFNREVGTLFNNGRTIRKGLTVKAKLPIRKMIDETAKLNNTQSFPEIVLINMEVKGNKMHIEFPDEIRIGLPGVVELFAQRGQDMNFPKQTYSMDNIELQMKRYEIDNIDKKSISVYFSAPKPVKIGSLMTLNNVDATLKRDALSKWSFVANGDYHLGSTSVLVSLTSQPNGFAISSKPSSIRSSVLVGLLDQRQQILKPEMAKYHLDDFVIEDFQVSGSVADKNIIRFSGKPTVFGVEDATTELVASEELLAMGILFKKVDPDNVFGRMLDKKMVKTSWAKDVNIGLIVSSPQNVGQLQFESEGLSRTKILPGAHLRCLIMRPDYTLCKGNSLCRVLSTQMPHGSAFHLSGTMINDGLTLSAPINDALVLSRSLHLDDASLQVRVDDSVQIYVQSNLNLRGVAVPFTGDMRVDNTGQLQLDMDSQGNWEKPFGLPNVQFTNASLRSAFEPGNPVPTFDLKTNMILGRDPTDSVRSIISPATVKINVQDPSKNSFTAKLRDITFERLASACGTKKPLLRFQEDATFLEDGTIGFEQSNKDEQVEGGQNNDTDIIYKGDLKATGRMKILGQSAEYTIKFLHDQTQLLTEVFLPDIGTNQGLLTIRAGIKQRKSGIERNSQSTNGPTLLVRMDPFTNSAVLVGKVGTLGFSGISATKIEDRGYSALVNANLPGNINTNVSLHSNYVPNIQNADFEASACLPIQSRVKSSLFNLLQDTEGKTKRTLEAAEARVNTTEVLYQTTKRMILKHKKRSLELTSDIRGKAGVMIKLKKGIKKHCVKDCGDSCMGLPSWKKSGISLAGRNAIGAPTWDSCRRKIPDLNCITRCLGRKVIENVKANNKQNELQGLMSQLADSKGSLQDARSLVNRTGNLVESTLRGLEEAKKDIEVGVNISTFLEHGAKPGDAIQVRNVCFSDSLNNAERSLIKFYASVDFRGEEKKETVLAALDGNLEKTIAEGLCDKLYPGYFDFNKKLEQVKVLLSNLDGEKAEIEKEMSKTGDESAQNEQRSQVVWNTEEDEFRKLAFGELPRFTLSDDETIHAFEEKSIWEVAPTNNPLFDNAPGDNQIITHKTVDPKLFTQELDKESTCGQLRSSVNRYRDIINPLSEFTENFLQEKIMFYRQKNRRLADLRMIDDQIKSDCFLENCTMEDMDNALSYLARARDGTLKWAGVIENQIEDQNKVALGYFSKRTADIIEADKGVSLRQYISKVKEVAQNAIKKSDITKKSETDEKIQKLAKELHSLLLGVKNSEELSKVAPKIFSMKRQIQTLKRNKIPCTDKAPDKDSSNGKEDKKLRAVKLTTVDRHNATTSKPSKKQVKQVNPTKKDEVTTHTSTNARPTELENPVLKDTVERYPESRERFPEQFNVKANSDSNRERDEILASHNRFTDSEYVNTPQDTNQYFTNNDQQNLSNDNMYNLYPYWERYVKK